MKPSDEGFRGPEPRPFHRMVAAAIEGDRDALQKAISEVDESSALPLDFMLSAKENKALFKAGRREVIPVVFLP